MSLSAALQDANCPSHNVLRMVAGNQQHAVEKADNYEPSIIVQYQVLMATANKRMLIVHFMKG